MHYAQVLQVCKRSSVPYAGMRAWFTVEFKNAAHFCQGVQPVFTGLHWTSVPYNRTVQLR